MTPGFNKVCQGKFCCLLNISSKHLPDSVIFGAFSGLHVVSGRYYLEICLLQGLPGPQPWHVSLAGTFSTQHVFPQALHTLPLPPGEIEVSPDGLFTVKTNHHTVGIVARNYDLDKKD